jgi:hypothetical protein
MRTIVMSPRQLLVIDEKLVYVKIGTKVHISNY